MLYNLFMKKSRLIILCFITLVWTFLVYFNGLYSFDMTIYKFIESFRCAGFTYFFKVITFFASVKYIIMICLLMFIMFCYKKDKRFLYLVLIIIFSTCFNLIVKFIVGRERPSMLYWLIEESNYSFPSGHSMTAMVLYGCVCYFINRCFINKKYKIVINCLLWGLICLIGLSRIYLGVHYFSDVVGGYLYGLIVLFVSKLYLERGNKI